MKFTEEKLESAIIKLLGEQSYPHVLGEALVREPQEVLIAADIHAFLSSQYQAEGITASEIDAIIRALQVPPASDLYDSNKTIMKWVSDGFPFKREDHTQKDLHISLLD